jgi:hypothetical protein
MRSRRTFEMKKAVLAGALLGLGVPASTQTPDRSSVRAVPQQSTPAPVDPSAAQVPVVDEPTKSRAADPIANPRAGYVGPLPAIPKTFVYPPGEGQYKFEAAGLSLGDDGYYYATEGNGFFMWFPPTAIGMPVSLTCSVKRQTLAFGTLSWAYYWSGEGGGVGFRFGPGETETNYQTNFTNGDVSLVMMKLTLPPGAGLKQCRVSGTFEQTDH